MRKVFAKVDPDGSSGKAFTKLEKNVQKALADMFVDMTTDTAEKLGTIKAAGMLKKLNTTNEGGVRYMSRNVESITKDTVKQDLTDVFNGNNVTSGSYIPLLKSTPFAVRYITGYKIDRPVIVDKKKSYFDMHESGKFKEDRSHHYHGMGIDGFIDALTILDDPEFVIEEEKDNGKFHYAFISANNNGEEICIVFQMNVSKLASQMNGYDGGYYNLDITEFVATDEWLEDHGAEPGMSYKDYLLSFSGNSIVYDRSIHREQLEKARNIDSESAGVAASYANNRASDNKVPQPETVVNYESTNNEKIRRKVSVDQAGAEGTLQQKINATMTMAEAKRMIDTAFKVSDIAPYYDGEYKNGEEWLRGEGAEEVAMYIENEYELYRKYIEPKAGLNDYEFSIADVINAYLEGTLVGQEKPKPKRLDISQSTRIKDDRFYSPQKIENAKETYQLALQRATGKDSASVGRARAEILLFSHNKGAAELLGITQAELNKKIRSWTRYSADARNVSERINSGVAEENRWTGIENCSWLSKARVTNEDIDRMVGKIEGDSNGYQRRYIARVMLAADTHIDYSGLNFKFASSQEVNEDYGGHRVKKVAGFYDDSRRLIEIGSGYIDSLTTVTGSKKPQPFG